MSFGFSVGDFLAVANLIRGIVSSLRTDSTASYNALIVDLEALQRALQEIEHPKCPPGEEAAVNGVKIAALVCQHPLDEFAGKLKKFQSLGIGKGGKLGRREMLVMWGRKVQWGFPMEEEVMKLRAYLAAHIGSLNMKLITYGLKNADITAQHTSGGQVSLQKTIEAVQSDITGTQRDIAEYGVVIRVAIPF